MRFIEWMPVGAAARDWRARVVSAAEIRARIEAEVGSLVSANVNGAGPARIFKLPDAAGTLGFIGAVSEHFCANCNRLRLTADGKLRPCLLAVNELDLRTPLRQGASDAEIQALLLEAVRAKPQGHHLADDAQVRDRAMAQIGG